MTKYLTISVMGETCMAYPEGRAVACNNSTIVMLWGGVNRALIIRHQASNKRSYPSKEHHAPCWDNCVSSCAYIYK